MDNHILKDYFNRIGYKGSQAPTLKTLQSLHEHHWQSIAFENLNSLLGLPVKLDLDPLIKKLILQVNIQNKWKPLYSFDLQEQFPGDYEVANYYISQSPASHFTKDLMVSRRASNCCYTLNNNKFNIYHYGNNVEKHTLMTGIQKRETLTGIFGLNLSGLTGLSSKLESIV